VEYGIAFGPPTGRRRRRPPLTWRLMGPPPAHWYPLVPVERGDRIASFAVGSVELATGVNTTAPRSVALTELAATGLGEEELAREGRRLVRTVSTTRWTDGGLHACIAPRTLPGRGEGASGVRFDAILADDPLER
jgi:hypothetical protein